MMSFGYGEFTPLAIRRFMRKAYNEGNPEYLFLIGKSSRVDLRSQRNPNQLASSRNRELVPTLGAPGSDFVYTTGFAGLPNQPAFPVGRLSVTEPIMVYNYLNKVREKESAIKKLTLDEEFRAIEWGDYH
jgi:hypothetical protein